MVISLRDHELARVNSLTKYPSIPTFHTLMNGKLVEPTVATPVVFPAGPVAVSEKVDGANGRIVLAWGDYFIGSREEFVYAKGDYIGDHKDGLMDALKPVAEKLTTWQPHFNATLLALGTDNYDIAVNSIVVAFFEIYGGHINAHKQYTTSGKVGVRLFDVAVIPNAAEMLQRPPEKLAGWRDHGGQPFLTVAQLRFWADKLGLDVVPSITDLTAASLGATTELGLQRTLDWMRAICTHSAVKLDEGAGGRPEGVVLRSNDRKVIAKLRFEDYERVLRMETLRTRGKK